MGGARRRLGDGREGGRNEWAGDLEGAIRWKAWIENGMVCGGGEYVSHETEVGA